VIVYDLFSEVMFRFFAVAAILAGAAGNVPADCQPHGAAGDFPADCQSDDQEDAALLHVQQVVDKRQRLVNEDVRDYSKEFKDFKDTTCLGAKKGIGGRVADTVCSWDIDGVLTKAEQAVCKTVPLFIAESQALKVCNASRVQVAKALQAVSNETCIAAVTAVEKAVGKAADWLCKTPVKTQQEFVDKVAAEVCTVATTLANDKTVGGPQAAGFCRIITAARIPVKLEEKLCAASMPSADKVCVVVLDKLTTLGSYLDANCEVFVAGAWKRVNAMCAI